MSTRRRLHETCSRYMRHSCVCHDHPGRRDLPAVWSLHRTILVRVLALALAPAPQASVWPIVGKNSDRECLCNLHHDRGCIFGWTSQDQLRPGLTRCRPGLAWPGLAVMRQQQQSSARLHLISRPPLVCLAVPHVDRDPGRHPVLDPDPNVHVDDRPTQTRPFAQPLISRTPSEMSPVPALADAAAAAAAERASV